MKYLSHPITGVVLAFLGGSALNIIEAPALFCVLAGMFIFIGHYRATNNYFA